MELRSLTVRFCECSMIINESARPFLLSIYKQMCYIFETEVHKYKIRTDIFETLFDFIIATFHHDLINNIFLSSQPFCIVHVYWVFSVTILSWELLLIHNLKKKSIYQSVSKPIAFYELYVSLLGKCRFRCSPQFYWSEICTWQKYNASIPGNLG